ncbi:MAG: hypothetical protein SGBAC_012055 [Bacillariaceae sp.]
MCQMTSSAFIDIQGAGALPATKMLQNPAKPSENAYPNHANTIDDFEDAVSTISGGTNTTSNERSCCCDHDNGASDHECMHCDAETVETACTVKSILKEPEADWASIRSEGPWKRLSEPNLPIGPLNEKPKGTRHNRSVSFDSVQLRQYSQTLGDNPCVPYGPPIQLDWKYEEEELAIPVDEYECRDRKWKHRQQMIMNCHKRKSMLTFYYGFSEEELKQAEKSIHKIRRQRSWTQALEPVYILEDVVSSAYRRAKTFARKRRTFQATSA